MNINRSNSIAQFLHTEDFNVKDLCDCPIPCRRVLYEPVITYAKTSNFDFDGIMRSDYIPEVQQRFISARETVEREDKVRAEKNVYNVTY